MAYIRHLFEWTVDFNVGGNINFKSPLSQKKSSFFIPTFSYKITHVVFPFKQPTETFPGFNLPTQLKILIQSKPEPQFQTSTGVVFLDHIATQAKLLENTIVKK